MEFREQAKCQITLFQLPDTMVSGQGRAVPNFSLSYSDRNCLAATFYEGGGRGECQTEESVDFQHIKPALHALEQLHKSPPTCLGIPWELTSGSLHTG